MSLQKIKTIARCVRKAFEEIEKIETGTNVYNLGGFCYRASIQLYLACNDNNINIQIVEGEGHIFNVYKNKIIDITATQFGYIDKIFVRNVNDIGLKFYHKPIYYHYPNKVLEIDQKTNIKDRNIVLMYL